MGGEREAGNGISFSFKIAFRIMHKSPFPPTILCVTFVNHGIYVSKERRDLRSTLTNDYAIMPDNSTAVNRMKNIVSYAAFTNFQTFAVSRKEFVLIMRYICTSRDSLLAYYISSKLKHHNFYFHWILKDRDHELQSERDM